MAALGFVFACWRAAPLDNASVCVGSGSFLDELPFSVRSNLQGCAKALAPDIVEKIGIIDVAVHPKNLLFRQDLFDLMLRETDFDGKEICWSGGGRGTGLADYNPEAFICDATQRISRLGWKCHIKLVDDAF